MTAEKDCCSREKGGEWKKGIFYGLLPHSFCIAFLLFSLLGATAAAAFFRRWLASPHFFPLLLGLSFLFATLSAAIYLKKTGLFSWSGIKRKKGYLALLYGTVIGVNLILVLFVFPLAANWKFSGKNTAVLGEASLATETIRVNIPCSGHAPLISSELEEIDGVAAVRFRLPNLFDVSYDRGKTSLEEVLKQDIFKSFPAKRV